MVDTGIEIKDLSVVLGRDFRALQDVTLSLSASKIIGFIGPSGAGKTTLIRSIVGRQKIQAGSITVFGLPAGSAQLRQVVSYMTQETAVYQDLTVSQNLQYFATMIGVPRKQAGPMITTILETIDMVPQANQLVSKLSGGQKQRVSLGVALIGSPKLMVLDEPTVGLDPVLREQLWKLFRRLTEQGTTLIISSHVMDEAERCDELVLVRDGVVVAHDTPAEICKNAGVDTVEQSFIKLVEASA